jgi:hypothetical protein
MNEDAAFEVVLTRRAPFVSGQIIRASSRPSDPSQPRPRRAQSAASAAVTARGHPCSIFRRAVEPGNLILAEGMARELGQVTLDEALELVALVAQEDPRRHPRYRGALAASAASGGGADDD